LDDDTTTLTAMQATVRCTMAIRRIHEALERDDNDDVREALLLVADALEAVETCIQVMWLAQVRRRSWWHWWA